VNNLVKRTLTGIIFVVLILASILTEPYLFSLLFLGVTALGLWEFYSLVEKAGIFPNKLAGTFSGMFLFASIALIAMDVAGREILMGNFVLVFMIFLFELYRKIPNPFTNIAFTFFGILYVALPFSLLNFFPNPAFLAGVHDHSLLLGFFFLIWVNETGAYLVGSAIGRRRLFPRISPKKTWEGVGGGGALSLLTSLVLARFYTHVMLIDWLVIAAIVVVFSTYGDLFESMFKRSIDAKDSGRLLPGHGGILDRFDGVIMAAPFVFLYLTLFY
jgi:phosphatidate cytidylyltransferase